MFTYIGFVGLHGLCEDVGDAAQHGGLHGGYHQWRWHFERARGTRCALDVLEMARIVRGEGRNCISGKVSCGKAKGVSCHMVLARTVVVNTDHRDRVLRLCLSYLDHRRLFDKRVSFFSICEAVDAEATESHGHASSRPIILLVMRRFAIKVSTHQELHRPSDVKRS